MAHVPAPAAFRRLDTDVAGRVADMPTFLLAELVIMAACLLNLAHAMGQPRAGGRRRRHLLLWWGAMCGGLANDVVFMALPLVDNFWHGQAAVMLTPRLPLYIVALYNVFLYTPTAFLWWARVPAPALSPLVGLLTAAFYAPVDVVGARFLWWTWHDTDNTVGARLAGVPVASSCWVCVYSACFAWLFARFVGCDGADAGANTVPARSSSLPRRRRRWWWWHLWARPFALVCGLAVPLMMIKMMLLQMLMGGEWRGAVYVPGVPPELPPVSTAMFFVVVAGYSALALRGLLAAPPAARPRGSASGGGSGAQNSGGGDGGDPFRAAFRWFAVLGAHFGFFLAVTHLGNSAAARSVGVHQSVGPCDLRATDYTGMERLVHVCPGRVLHSDDFVFAGEDDGGDGALAAAVAAAAAPGVGSDTSSVVDWYAIVGTPATDAWRLAATAECLGGLFLFLGFWYRRVQQLFVEESAAAPPAAVAEWARDGRHRNGGSHEKVN